MTAAENSTIEFPAPFVETYSGPGTPKTREHDWHQIAASAPTMAATMRPLRSWKNISRYRAVVDA